MSFRTIAAAALLVPWMLSAVPGGSVAEEAGISLWDMEGPARLRMVLSLMDSEEGAAELGALCARASGEARTKAARGIVRFVAGWAMGERSEAERARIRSFGRAAIAGNDEQVRLGALECLRGGGGRGTVDAVLEKMFSDPSPRIRKAALEAAGALAGPGLLDALTAVVRDPERPERERMAALSALAGIFTPGAVKVLRGMVADEDVRLAAAAVAALARVPLREALDGVFAAALAKRKEVRTVAYRGLVRFRHAGGFPIRRVAGLADRLKVETGEAGTALRYLLASCGIKEGVEAGVRRMGERGVGPEETALLVEGLGFGSAGGAFPAVKAAFEKFPDSPVLKRKCYLAAGLMGTERAVRWLLERLKDEDVLSPTSGALYRALELAARLPADSLLPFLSGGTRQVPSHLFLLALARGALSEAERSIDSVARSIEEGAVTSRVRAAALILAARGAGKVRSAARNIEGLSRVLDTPLGKLDATDDAVWLYILFAADSPSAVARGLAARLDAGLPAGLLGSAVGWSRAAAEAALGAWERLTEKDRRAVLESLDARYGLGWPARLVDAEPERAVQALEFLLGMKACVWRRDVKRALPVGRGRQAIGLVVEDGRLRWKLPNGGEKTPVCMVAPDVPDREKFINRLLEAGVLVIDEPFMAVDVVVVRDGGRSPWRSGSEMTVSDMEGLLKRVGKAGR